VSQSEREAQQVKFEETYDTFSDELEFIIEEAVATATNNFLLVTGVSKLDTYAHMRQFAQLVALAAVTRAVADEALFVDAAYLAPGEQQEKRRTKRSAKAAPKKVTVTGGEERLNPGQYL